MNQEKFLRKARTWARICGLLPGVQAIFLSGSVAQGRATNISDIDFFIIARHGQIWTARFFVFALLYATGQMRTNTHHAGKICPNHFITETHLRIRERDLYAAKLFSHNKPLYDPNGIFWHFVQENKDWVQKHGEHFPIIEKDIIPLRTRKPWAFEQWFESCVALAQKEKIRRNPEYRLPGAKIVLEDYELRFHPKPRNRSQDYKITR
ncbi:nucleotidyltransferase domain-containing protein [Candidatus Gracilibacteria bacterium]|nr:nucleotidyltransferase domain-containing protein [Candidatus Gracilibacteria bacterium]